MKLLCSKSIITKARNGVTNSVGIDPDNSLLDTLKSCRDVRRPSSVESWPVNRLLAAVML